MNELNVSDTTINEAARACATRLAKWFGSEEEAIEALQKDPVAMAQIAMADFMQSARKIAVRAHMNPGPFARECLGVIKAGGQLPN